MSNTPSDFQRHLRTAEAARFLGLSDRTLEKHRSYGTGPIYRKIGGRVVYTMEDLRAWSERGARRSTTDPEALVVSPAKRGGGAGAVAQSRPTDGAKR